MSYLSYHTFKVYKLDRDAKSLFSEDPVTAKAQVVVKNTEVRVLESALRVLILIKNEGTVPLRKINLRVRLYAESNNSLIADRMVPARWDQPNLKDVSNLREKVKLIGVLQPQEAVTVILDLQAPTEIPMAVPAKAFVSIASADHREEP